MNGFMEYVISRFTPPDIKRYYGIHRKVIHFFTRFAAFAMDGHYDRDIISDDGHHIPVRVYPPSVLDEGRRVIVFFHGGGWVIDDIDRYHKVCRQLSEITGSYVVSVDYRLAPEHKYPAGLEDCFEVTEKIIQHVRSKGMSSHDVILCGDSAGANLAAAVSLMARDCGRFRVRRQILIYPCISCEYGEDSPYKSVHDNGEGCILTAERMRGYLDLYLSDPHQKDDPYVSPIKAKKLSGMPDTLVITSGRDPLRDEGEAYAKRLHKEGNSVMAFRIKDAYHGFFCTDLMRHPHAKKAVSMIMYFLRLTD